MSKTEIEWTDRVWNPVRGCSKISPGCTNCYAETMASRFCQPGAPFHGVIRHSGSKGKWNGEVDLIYDKLDDPVRWRKPSKIFVNSMSDLFHEKVPDGFIGEVFGVMAMAQQHTFQILTKRALRMEQWFGSWAANEAANYAADLKVPWPLPNVWLGVSVESQDWASERIPPLLGCPAEIRFVSAEPLLEELDLTLVEDAINGGYVNGLEEGIDWVIVGCETGPKSRRRSMEESWVRDLRWQCRSTDTAFFYKQKLDENGKRIILPLLEGVSWSEYPNERRNRKT